MTDRWTLFAFSLGRLAKNGCRWPVRQVSFAPMAQPRKWREKKKQATNFNLLMLLVWRAGARRGFQLDERPA